MYLVFKLKYNILPLYQYFNLCIRFIKPYFFNEKISDPSDSSNNLPSRTNSNI